MSVVILHQPSVNTSTWDRIKEYDVILTSYGKLAGELKKHLKWEATLAENPAAVKTKKDGQCLLQLIASCTC